MALWQTRYVILTIWQVLVVAGRGATAVEAFATTPRFEEFGNFGGSRGFHQFHGWLSNALDDNAGSQSQGFPAGYTHPGTGEDVFSQILPDRQEEPDVMLYQATPKSRTKLPERHVKSKKLTTKPAQRSDPEEVPNSYIGKTYNVQEPIAPEGQPKGYKYYIPIKQSASKIEEDATHTGSIYDGMYESMKLHQKQSKPSENSPTEESARGPTEKTQLTGAVYDVYEPVSQFQIKPSKYSTTPKQRAKKKEKQHIGAVSPIKDETAKYKAVKPIQKLEMPVKVAKPPARKINEVNSFYQVANNGGFQPILYIPQEQLEAAIFDTAKQQASARGNNNVIYVYPNPYQQTLAAIDPAFRKVIKVQEPIEHHKNYLSYKSTLSTKII